MTRERTPSRREVLGAATAVASLMPAKAAAQAQQMGGQLVNIGVIGVGANGSGHLDEFDSLRTRLRVTAVCDIYKPRLERAVAKTGAKGYHDYRDLLADKNVDAVLISTPDHWHAQMAIDAMRAGKDVDVEKPMALTIDEARRMVQVAKETGRILAVDAEHTAHGIWTPARAAVSGGVLGKLIWSQTSRSRNETTPPWHGKIEAELTPQTLDWDRFLGSAPKVPFSPERYFRWRRYWDYSSGIATDLYVHHLTPLMKVAGPELPVRVVGGGGNWFYPKDVLEVPDTFVITADFPSKHTIVVGGSLANSVMMPIVMRGHVASMSFHGPDPRRPAFLTIRPEPAFVDEARERVDKSGLQGKWLTADQAAYEVDSGRFAATKGGVFRIDSPPSEGHFENFLRCVRTREKPIMDGEFAYMAHVTIMMAIESYRRDIVAFFDPATGTVMPRPVGAR